ncbi:TonB family protein [Permianibacter sp. IMCC34836]|uniref:TonB family protein n=1 Tax=Permianibacter fluminis TaxID=2738515 RepID=UPI0015540801|nr:TonB family protein [Permianibacter fluminis]NQD36555.1 TonB family protein [Permianibacter fluminis]
MRHPLLSSARPRRLLPLLGLCLSALLASGPAVTADSLEALQLPDGRVLLNGVGVARLLNEDMYVAVLYASRPTGNPAELLDARQRRRLQLRILADRLYPSGVARHFRDLVSLNNPRDEITREAKNLNRFYGLFQYGLMRGDEVIFDNVAGKGLLVSINGQTVAEFSSPMMFDLLLRCLIGDKPPNLQFRSQLLGDQDAAGRAANLARFAALQPQDERKTIYATVKAPAADNAIAETPSKPEPAKIEPAKPEPVKTVAENKPAPVVSKPASPPRPVEKPEPVSQSVTSPGTTNTNTANPSTSKVPAHTELIAAVTPGGNTDAVKAPTVKTLTADEVTALLQRYEGQLRERLLAAMEYPRRDMKRKYGITQMARQKGKVVLRLNLDTGGDVNAAWLQERTNEAILDNAALALVDKVAPFPPLPQELPDSAYEFYVPLEFDPDR